jgi:hypothetical protein
MGNDVIENDIGKYAIIKQSHDANIRYGMAGLKVRLCSYSIAGEFYGCDFSEVENFDDLPFKSSLHNCRDTLDGNAGWEIYASGLDIISDNPVKKFFDKHPLEK